MGKYRVIVWDNFHYMDADESYVDGEFDSPEAALDRCRQIVEISLKDCYTGGQTAAQLFECYCSFGEDPSVPTVVFSAWEYARTRCEEICGGGKEA